MILSEQHAHDEDSVETLYESKFDLSGIAAVRHRVADCLRGADVPGDQMDDILIAVGEVISNAVRHGGGAGDIRVTRSGRRLQCVITDRGPGFGEGRDYAPESVRPEAEHGRGLWLVFALCTLVELNTSPDGTLVRLMIDLPDPVDQDA